MIYKKIEEDKNVVKLQIGHYMTLQIGQNVVDVVLKKFVTTIMQLHNLLRYSIVVKNVVVVAVVLK